MVWLVGLRNRDGRYLGLAIEQVFSSQARAQRWIDKEAKGKEYGWTFELVKMPLID